MWALIVGLVELHGVFYKCNTDGHFFFPLFPLVSVPVRRERWFIIEIRAGHSWPLGPGVIPFLRHYSGLIVKQKDIKLEREKTLSWLMWVITTTLMTAALRH